MVNLMRISLLFIDNCFAPFAPGHQNHIRKKAPHASCVSRLWLEVPPRFELGNKGFADLCLTTWPWHRTLILWKRRSKYYILSVLSINGADDEARTRYLHLGKVALYQMSYIRKIGASDRNRTNDTGIFSPLLYRLSYRGKFGDPERARTVDL